LSRLVLYFSKDMSSTAASVINSGGGDALSTSAIVAEAVTGSHSLKIEASSSAPAHSAWAAIAGASGTTLMAMA
jgi:hypothetical protein